MTWRPADYHLFSAPRLRPALDLLARIDRPRVRRAADLGCGTGEVTRLIRQRWPEAVVQGIDSSREMLDRARAQDREPDAAVDWLEADIATWAPDTPPDLIFSNAALNWLPDHARLLPRLLRGLAPGGTLAVQMPRNHEAPSHTTAVDVARSGPWADALAPLLGPPPVASPATYHDILRPCADTLEIWETEYLHVLEGDDPVLAWTRSTWLRPFLDALAGDQKTAFERACATRLRLAYPLRADGTTLFPFRRLFIVATANP